MSICFTLDVYLFHFRCLFVINVILDAPVLSVDRTRLSEAASRLPTDDLWSVGATVRYLLVSGLLAELVWFCKHIGDLKSSLCVALIVSDHLTSLKHIKR